MKRGDRNKCNAYTHVFTFTPKKRQEKSAARFIVAVMVLTMDELKDIQSECLADDVDIIEEMTAWTAAEAVAFFEVRMPGLEPWTCTAHSAAHKSCVRTLVRS